jgi:hypothetical protein
MGETPRVDRLKSIVDQFVQDVAESAAPRQDPPEDGPKWMRIKTFAEAHGYAPRTISRWVRLNMPHIGKGHSCRINVSAAIAWIANGGPTASARKLGFASHARSLQ